MDERDRSGSGDKPDRETGSADNDTGNDDPIDRNPTGDTGDPAGGTGDPTGDNFGGDDPTGDGAGDSDTSDETPPETGPVAVAETSGDKRARASGDRSETGRTGTGTSRERGASDEGLLHRFRHDRVGPLMWVREMLTSVAIVLLIGLILFGVSGVWPPMVAVESGSMEPNMEVGDLVFVTEPGRLAPDAAGNDIGVVTHEVGETVDYRTFGSYGSVVIYRPPGRTASPIIHRAMFHVEEGENWYDRADDQYHSAAGCGELNHCPAPHDGFITLGDDNANYDQASGLAAPVRSDWVTGVARVRIPYLGYVRLIATGQAEPSDVLATSVAMQTGSVGIDEVNGGDTADAKASVSGGGVTADVVG